MKCRIALRLGILALLLLCTAAHGAPCTATISTAGEVRLVSGRTEVARIVPGLHTDGWKSAGFAPAAAPPASGQEEQFLAATLRTAGGVIVDVRLTVRPDSGGLDLVYSFAPRGEVDAVNSLHVAVELPARQVSGRPYAADGITALAPTQHTNTVVVMKPLRSLRLDTADAGALTVSRGQPAPLLLQDNRLWSQDFVVRVLPAGAARSVLVAGETVEIAFRLQAEPGLAVTFDRPVTISAGPEWVALEHELEVVPGSVLDLSALVEAPAGRHGPVIAAADGTFRFERKPDQPVRFYGVNLCFSAQYLPPDTAEQLAARLARIGYNSVRLHHYEGALVARPDTTALRADRLEQLDALVAALKRNGLYITTDLFVSRPVPADLLWPGTRDDTAMNDFKMALHVNERAFSNWTAFARNLLTHRNPHTGMTYAEDPAVAWISLVNEGNVGNYVGGLKGPLKDDWRVAWNRWLARRYGSAAALETAWQRPPGGDPAAGTVPLGQNIWDATAAGRDLAAFAAETEAVTFRRMKQVVRGLGCRALLTSMNGWTNPLRMQTSRADMDYVDDHFYIDHPHFLERPWTLPSRCDNESPIAAGASGGRTACFVRLLDKPFTVSEYNYSGPGRFRGVGGILTGCRGSLQGWDALWRFAYSHQAAAITNAAPAGYFDTAADPLNLMAERAAICLYLRADMQPAPHTVALALPEPADHSAWPNRGVAPPWADLSWVTGVGTWLSGEGRQLPADLALPLGQVDVAPARQIAAAPFSPEAGPAVLAALRHAGWMPGNRTDTERGLLQSETAEITLDSRADVLTLNTPRTAGGYAPEGSRIETPSMQATIDKTDATVWVSSMDGRPLAESRRLLVCHLTDLQNSGARFAEQRRQTLLAWGTLPHLVADGRATVRLRLDRADRAAVYGLSMGGRRLERVPATVENGTLAANLNVRGPGNSARMAYEIVIE